MAESKQPKLLPGSWMIIGRIFGKAALLFLLINAVFAFINPMPFLGRISLYNWLLTGRQRLPYGENPSQSYNLSLNSIEAMIASHEVDRVKAEDEFRILVIGDSGTWGWLLENQDTLAGRINAAELGTADGRTVRAYNLGYPIMALSKDLLILDSVMHLDPDLILWPVTLESFQPGKQLDPPLVNQNPGRMRMLIERFDLSLDPLSDAFSQPTFLEKTLVGRRRPLADLLRLQLYGVSWSVTQIDQVYPEDFSLRQSDFEEDLSWGEYDEPAILTGDDLSLDILSAGITLAGDVPVLIVNEPIFISEGVNSDLRYNAWYPRWAYDQYRQLMSNEATANQWHYLDLWDAIPGEAFTDSPVHLTPDGVESLATLIIPSIRQLAGDQ